MKIYLLIVLIGALWTAIRFTSTPKSRLKAASAIDCYTLSPVVHSAATASSASPGQHGLRLLIGHACRIVEHQARKICVGARPPLTARTRMRIAGADATPCTGWIAQAAEAAIKRRQHLGDARPHARSASARRRISGCAALRESSSPAWSRSATCAMRRAASGEARCRDGIVERRIHQHDVDAVRAKTGGGERFRASRQRPASRPRPRCHSTPRWRDASAASRRIDLDQHQIDARLRAAPPPGRRRRHRHRNRRHVRPPAPRSPPPAAWRRVRRGGRITGCRNRSRPPRNASSVTSSRRSVIGPQFMGQPGIGEKLPRLAVIVLMDQNPPRQNAERALDHAHVLIQHQMMDVGAIEQRADRRHQHHIVGSHQFPQREVLLRRPRLTPEACGACQPLPALAASIRHFSIVIAAA